MSKAKWATIAFATLATLLLIFAVGWIWFGWGYIADNRAILDSLPVPPGVERISVGSGSYSEDELALTPPDGWGTHATYQAPPEASREEVIGFYLSKLSPEWRSCVEDHPVTSLLTGEETGAVWKSVCFTRGSSLINLNANVMEGRHKYVIYVDHDKGDERCNG